MRQNQTNIKKKHLRSIAKQVIQIYINHYRPIIPEGIYLNLIGLRGERSQTYPYMLIAKQGSIWYQFYNVFGMTDSGRASNPRPSAHGANALATETAAIVKEYINSHSIYHTLFALNTLRSIEYLVSLTVSRLPIKNGFSVTYRFIDVMYLYIVSYASLIVILLLILSILCF